MKKYILGILVLVGTVTSCSKTNELETSRQRTQGDLQYTIQVDSLKEVWGRDTVKFDFTKNVEVHNKWMLDMWLGDAAGNTIPNMGFNPASGFGVRFTPIDPNSPNGEQVLRPFTWFMEQGTNKIIANFGNNRAEVSIIQGFVIIHQFAGPGVNEIERWYYGRQVTNGLNMKGNGAKRTS